MREIDMTPTKAGYLRMLQVIVDTNPDPLEVQWAKDEMARVNDGQIGPFSEDK